MTTKVNELSSMFDPINKLHAIVEMAIFCHFAPEFEEAVIDRLFGLEQGLKDKLPKFRAVPGHTIDIDSGPGKMPSINTRRVGVDMRKYKSDGSIEWKLETSPKHIAVHCSDYTQWDIVRPEAKLLLQKALDLVGVSKSTLIALGLKFVDRFTYKGEEEKYHPSGLFYEDTPYLHRRAFNSGSRWHCHIGWFESFPTFKAVEFLNQLNVDAAYLPISGKRRHVTTIDHNVIARRGGAAILEENNIPDDLLDAMHDTNKKVLVKLLTQEMATRINLGDVGVK